MMMYDPSCGACGHTLQTLGGLKIIMVMDIHKMGTFFSSILYFKKIQIIFLCRPNINFRSRLRTSNKIFFISQVSSTTFFKSRPQKIHENEVKISINTPTISL